MADSILPPVSIAPITRPAPLRVKVADTIRELIAGGTLANGRHLVESELAQAVGVSRQPVREALQILARDGWVDLRPGYGAFVHSPTGPEIDDVFRVRSALEAEAAGRAAGRVREGSADPADLEALRRCLAEGSAEAASPETARLVDYNAVLHGTIISIARNQVLADMAAVISGRVRWYFAAIAVSRAPMSWTEHAAVVDAIASGDEAEARSGMRSHCERSRLELLDLLVSGPA